MPVIRSCENYNPKLWANFNLPAYHCIQNIISEIYFTHLLFTDKYIYVQQAPQPMAEVAHRTHLSGWITIT